MLFLFYLKYKFPAILYFFGDKTLEETSNKSYTKIQKLKIYVHDNVVHDFGIFLTLKATLSQNAIFIKNIVEFNIVCSMTHSIAYGVFRHI